MRGIKIRGHSSIAVACLHTEFGNVSIGRAVDALILGVFSLLGGLPKVQVTVVHIAVVKRHHRVPADPDTRLLHDSSTKILDHCPVDVRAG